MTTPLPRHLVGVWNPSYAESAMDAHLAILLNWAEARAAGKAEPDDVYVWWAKLASPNRQGPLPHAADVLRLEDQIVAGIETRDPRPDFTPVTAAEMLLQADGVITAQVAFDGRVRRWIEERCPGGRDLPDGRYVVTYRVADAGWFVREVLQYGDGAEVLEPSSLREAVRRVVEANRA